ncbi:MAG TPA: HAD-IA family hydrolase [Pirellulaceae bacterium]|nr:HAD-IA family hydrolase [Pirellulaceae bacterium]
MQSGIRWILFDAVGTLIYPRPPVAEVYRDGGRQFGSLLDAEEIATRFRRALAAENDGHESLTRPPTSEFAELARWRRIVAAVLDDVPEGGQARLFQSLWRHFAQPGHWRVFDDVQPALLQLADAGFRLGIASNYDGRLRTIVAAHAELAHCEQIFVSSQVHFTKPDPRFFRAVGEQLEAEPAEILLVGDDWLADIEGARASGWQAIFLNREAELRDATTIASLSELPSRYGAR